MATLLEQSTVTLGSLVPWNGVTAHAQVSESAAIAGHVSDATSSPLSGVAVSIDGPALLGGPRTTTTDGSGMFRIMGLPAGIYELRVSLRGFTTLQSTVELIADATTTRDARLALSPLEELVSVSAPAGVDVTSASKPTRIGRELLQHLPSQRVLSDVLNLAPGVNGSIAMGGVQHSNGMFIDGVNAANLMTGGPWISFNYNWVEEVQVLAEGAGAQYGEFSGVVQKSRLRSGSDLFRASAELLVTEPRWVDANTSSLSVPAQQSFAARAERIQTWHDENGDAGGPIRHGRAWFFGGVQSIRHRWVPALYAGPGASDETDRRALARVDLAPIGSARVTAFYEYDRQAITGNGIGPSSPIETTTSDRQPNHNWNVAGRWWKRQSAVELSFVGSGGMLSSDPMVGSRESGPSPHYDNLTGVTSGSAFYYQDLSSERRAVRGAFMKEQSIAGHSHVFDIGAEYEWGSQRNAFGYPGGRLYLDRGGLPAFVYLWAGESYTDRVRRSTVYVQDRWPLGLVTLEPGLRFTTVRGVESQGTVLQTAAISPRLGLAWDIGGAHTSVAAVHVGRYHDAVLTPNFAFARADQDPDQIYARVLGPNDFQEISRTVYSNYGSLDPQITPSFFDQYGASLEHALTPTLRVSGQLLFRRFRNFMGMVDRGTIYVPVSAQDPGPDGRVGTNDDGGQLEVFRNTNPGHASYYFTNPTGLYRNYRSATITARYRPSSSTEAVAFYTWSRSVGNVENAARANAAGPELWGNGIAAQPNRAINNDGANTFDFPHELKVIGTWHIGAAGGLNVGGVYRYHTGQAWGRSAHLQETNEFVTFGVRVEPRDARRTAALNLLDLRVEKLVPLGGHRSLGLLVDVFNVANHGSPDPEMRRAIMEVSGPTFGIPQTWVEPRTARAAVRATF
jgi:hypothetical protein